MFAFDHTWDIENYSDIAEALNTSKAKNDLKQFIATKK